MNALVILLLFVGSALAGTDQGARGDFSGMADDFFGGTTVSADLEAIPSEGCVEGDMAMTANQSEVYLMLQEVTAEEERDRMHTAATNAFKMWPNQIFAYKFDPALSKEIRTLFKQAVNIYEEATCITFTEVQDGYVGAVQPILIKGNNNNQQCSSSVGGPGGQMNLLENVCDHLGICLHEIGHALGFFHEQTRSDRDEYVLVVEAHIKSGFEHNFKKLNTHNFDRYDYQSIMHYSCTAFSKDGRSKTMIPTTSGMEPKMGRQQMLSRLDKYKINMAYGCFENCPEDLASRCKHGGLPSKDCTCICPDVYTGPYCEIFKDTTDCSAEFYGPSGVIESPNYPGRYPPDLDCVYAISCQEEGQKVHLTFAFFDVEGWSCFFDYLNIQSGNIVDEIYADRFCDKELNTKIFDSKTNLVLMKFHSDDWYNYNGFKIEYKCE